MSYWFYSESNVTSKPPRIIDNIQVSEEVWQVLKLFSVNLTANKTYSSLMACLRTWTVVKKPLIDEQPYPVRAKVRLKQQPMHCVV